jgi:hypothetical protein
MTNDTRFAYVQIYADGTQALSLGDLTSHGSLTLRPNVNLLGRLGQVAGAQPGPDVGAAETFSSLVPSLDNAYLAASTVAIGVDFIDLNNYIYNMTNLSLLSMVNEQTFDELNKSNCHSHAFDDWIQQQLSQTTDPDEIQAINGDDFYVLSSHSAEQVVGPVWTRRNTFYLGYNLDIASRSDTWSGTDQFIMEFNVQGAILGQVASVPSLQRTDDLFAIGSQKHVTYDGRDVVSTHHVLNGGRTFTLPLSADQVAGYQPLIPSMNTGRHPNFPPRKPLPPVGRPPL